MRLSLSVKGESCPLPLEYLDVPVRMGLDGVRSVDLEDFGVEVSKLLSCLKW